MRSGKFADDPLLRKPGIQLEFRQMAMNEHV